MKKTTRNKAILLLSMAAALALFGCGQKTAEIAENTTAAVTAAGTAEPQAASGEQINILIAYFTWADNTEVEDQDAAVQSAMAHYESMGDAALYGTDAVSSASVVAPGNTARLGAWIQEETGGDLFSIQVKDLYPSDYDECMDRAAQEDGENARPELAGFHCVLC